jgi:hypothetical protein
MKRLLFAVFLTIIGALVFWMVGPHSGAPGPSSV